MYEIIIKQDGKIVAACESNAIEMPFKRDEIEQPGDGYMRRFEPGETSCIIKILEPQDRTQKAIETENSPFIRRSKPFIDDAPEPIACTSIPPHGSPWPYAPINLTSVSSITYVDCDGTKTTICPDCRGTRIYNCPFKGLQPCKTCCGEVGS